MVGVVFLALVILALVNIVFWWVMRIRLMRKDSARHRIEWLSFHSGDDVLDTYAALFPHSVLPGYCRFAFWTVLVSAAIVLCAMTMLKAFGK
jgi:Na+/H+ antiporter NhaC